jgi:hypothetical protein
MHIIFGQQQADAMKEKYTVLELDTFAIANLDQPVTAYCAVEKIPLGEMLSLPNHQNLHNQLLQNYRQKNWLFCLNVIDQLKGCWCGELDSFYDDLAKRIQICASSDLNPDWTPIITK